MNETNKKIMLVDGMALLFRGFYATSYRGNFMYTSGGIPTNGIYQFFRYLLDAIKTYEPTNVICCWDLGSKTFRTDMYPNYKANRGAPPEELVPQFDLVKDVVTSFDIPNIGIENYEADDCIGTLAHLYKDEHEINILTGDLDMLQLVTNNINVIIMRKGMGNYELFHQNNFYEKRNIYPNQYIDFKGLTGDSADNYPGVKGIGEKTAIRLLNEYETVENIMHNIESLTPALKRNLINDLEMFELSRDLATIKCNLEIKCLLNDSIWNINKDKVMEHFSKLEFKNMETIL